MKICRSTKVLQIFVIHKTFFPSGTKIRNSIVIKTVDLLVNSLNVMKYNKKTGFHHPIYCSN